MLALEEEAGTAGWRARVSQTSDGAKLNSGPAPAEIPGPRGSGLLQGRGLAKQSGLPGKKNPVEVVRGTGDLGELSPVRDQGRFERQSHGRGVAIGFDPVQKLDLGLRQRSVPMIPSGPARES